MDFAHLSSHIRIARDLALRDLEAKYKRSTLSWAWLLLTPLCLLGIYSFVFGTILGIEWKDAVDRKDVHIGFVLPFFVGLSIYLFASDVISSSATLLVSKRTYVVKSAFPMWVLWLSNLIRAGVVASVPFALVLLLALVQGRLTLLGLFWTSVSLLNMSLCIAAMSLFLTSLGPFFGDMSEAIRLLLRVLFYATPIAYPLSSVPADFRAWLWLNPLTSMIEPMRAAIVHGSGPNIIQVVLFAGLSLALLGFSAWMFLRIKGVIADVV
jgi:lipopolysaccharide transport system permease protein